MTDPPSAAPDPDTTPRTRLPDPSPDEASGDPAPDLVERERLMLDHLPVIVYRVQSDGPHRTVFISAGVEILGYTRDEWLQQGDLWSASLHPDDRDRVLGHLADAIRRGEVMDVQYRIRARDGSVRWLHDRGEFVRDESGNRVWQGIARDITEQRVAEEALRHSEERFRLAGQATREVIWDWDIQANALVWSEAAITTFGHVASDMAGDIDWWLEHVHPDDRARMTESVAAALAGHADRSSSEYRYRRGDGSYAHVLDRGIIARDAEGTPVRMVGSMMDISDRVEAAEAIRFQARLLDTVEQGVVATDLEGRVIFWNAFAERLYGYAVAEAIGRPILNLIIAPGDIEAAAAILARMTRGENWSGKIRVRRKDGSPFVALMSSVPLLDATGRMTGVVGVVVDTTERHQLEEQLRQSQKMEAVGRLAGGVAHDFNNLLTVIKTSTDLLLEDTDAADPRRVEVRQIAEASDRAAMLTRQLLAFSRKQILRPSVLDLHAVVRNVLPMLQRLLGEDIAIEAAAGDVPATILADVGQLEQVLVNLAVNARDAMPSGGRITIAIAHAQLDDPDAEGMAGREVTPVSAGEYAMLTVTDTGFGMSPEVAARAFEPFFTTKEAGKGTGLGLATVYGIVKQSGGHIWVYSEPGHGTVFKLYFPLVQEQATPQVTDTTNGRAPTGTETVLLVEDEENLRSLIDRILRRQGYTVLQSRNGVAALALADSYDRPIHLVVTDVVMPEMSGRELVDRLRVVRPAAAVIYMSGYTDDDVLRRGILEPGSHFLQKPFASRDLLMLVRTVLDARS